MTYGHFMLRTILLKIARIRHAHPSSLILASAELFKETQIVSIELANIINIVLEQANALGAEPAREAADLVWVIAAVPQHGRMHHTAAADLQPAAVLTDSAALTFADKTANIQLGARL